MDLIGSLLGSLLLWFGNGNIIFTYIGTIIFGLFMSSTYPTVLLLVEETTKVSGLFASIMMFGSSFGALTLPALVGNIISIYGIQYFHVMIVIMCVTLILFYSISLIIRSRILFHKSMSLQKN